MLEEAGKGEELTIAEGCTCSRCGRTVTEYEVENDESICCKKEVVR